MADREKLQAQIKARHSLHELQQSYPARANRGNIEEELKARQWISDLSEETKAELVYALNNGSLDLVLRRVADEALKLTSETERSVLKQIPIGLVDTTFPYGEVRVLENESKIVILHTGMMLLINDFADLVIAGVQTASRLPRAEAGLLIVSLSRKALHIALMFLSSYELKGSPFLIGPYAPDLETRIAGGCLCNYIEQFCVLHEYGHILQDAESTVAAAQAPVTLPEHELQADAWAYGCILKGVDTAQYVKEFPGSRQWLVIAPIVFVAISLFVENILRRAGWICAELGVDVPTGVDFSSYPTTAHRYSHAMQNLTNSAEATPQTMAIAKASWDLVGAMWSLCELGIKEGRYREIVVKNSPHKRRAGADSPVSRLLRSAKALFR